MNIDKQKFAMDIAGNYKVASVGPKILEIAKDTSNKRDVRTAALRALLKLDVNKNAALAGELLQDPKAAGDLNDIVTALGEFPGAVTTKVLSGIQNAEPELQQNYRDRFSQHQRRKRHHI